MAGRRVAARLSLLGAATHAAVELAAGSGFPAVSVLGPYAGAAAWVSGTRRCWSALSGTGPAADRVAALTASLGLAGVAAHYWGWPTRRGPAGLPWLETAEGMPARVMPAYNAVLLAWGTASAVAMLTGSMPRRWATTAAALATVPLLAHASRAEYRWLQRQRPAWWNRAVHA